MTRALASAQMYVCMYVYTVAYIKLCIYKVPTQREPGYLPAPKYHTFMDTFKLLKYRIPMSLCELLKNSPRNTNMLLLVPLIRLDLAKNNFQASCIWNGLIQNLMNRSSTNSLGIIVPGSSSNSDLSTYISLIKN